MQAEQGGKTDWENLPVALVEKSPEGERHARFHRQFVTLVRKHAQILVDDTRIHNLFHRHCFVAKEQCAPLAEVPRWKPRSDFTAHAAGHSEDFLLILRHLQGAGWAAGGRVCWDARRMPQVGLLQEVAFERT